MFIGHSKFYQSLYYTLEFRKLSTLSNSFVKRRGVKNSQACPRGHLYKAVTCIKRSSFPDIENLIWIEPLLRGHLFYKATFSLSQIWPLNTGMTIVKKMRDITLTYVHFYEYTKFSWMKCFKKKWPPWSKWNIIESGIKDPKPNLTLNLFSSIYELHCVRICTFVLQDIYMNLHQGTIQYWTHIHRHQNLLIQ